MSLIDFLGTTPELKIIDFLGEHIRYAYSKKEIAEYTGLSIETVNQTLQKLIDNKVIIDTKKDNSIAYKLAPTEVAKAIEHLVLTHSYAMAIDMETEHVDQNGKRLGLCRRKLNANLLQ